METEAVSPLIEMQETIGLWWSDPQSRTPAGQLYLPCGVGNHQPCVLGSLRVPGKRTPKDELPKSCGITCGNGNDIHSQWHVTRSFLATNMTNKMFPGMQSIFVQLLGVMVEATKLNSLANQSSIIVASCPQLFPNDQHHWITIHSQYQPLPIIIHQRVNQRIGHRCW